MPDTRIVVPLSRDEAVALVKLAEAEFRHPREQARMMLSAELKRQGLLPGAKPATSPAVHPSQNASAPA